MRLTARSLDCERGGRIVFRDLGFTIQAGRALVVTGPNGIGKSSLLRLIAGLTPKAGGMLELDGGEAGATIAEQCHYFGHSDALKPALSVEENLGFWQNYYGAGETGVGAALETVALDRIAHLPAAYLSAGQRRRLSLARLIVSPRPIWLLDEPTSALDTAGEGIFTRLANAHLASGGLIVAATHAPLAIAPLDTFDMAGVAA